MTAVRKDERVGLAELWIPLFAGPILWSLSEIVLYPVSAQGCFTGLLPTAVVPDATGARWFDGIWVIASIVLAALAVLLALRSFRRAREGNGATDAVLVRVRFMSYAGLIVSAVFLYALVINGLGIALSGSPCG
ncbi:MAG TPA: hypothetical protein VFK04_00910 [Gemmatimonadaceae bacterium]|nr:hypothetical protein [Gemmatimonadaceae bacterium]